MYPFIYLDHDGGIVYQNDTLQFISHEEGRTRWALHHYLNGSTKYGFEYDYFLKDHLGNTRMVLSQEKDTSQYIATMEAAYRNTENQLFYNIPQSSYARSAVSGYPSDPTTNPNDSLARVNGNGPKTGPAILLKVMSGDVLDIATKSFYKSGGTVNSPVSTLTDIINSLAAGLVTATAGGHGVITDFTNSSSPMYAAVNAFLPANDPNTTGKPKAYLNWILLDDQFKGVSTYPQSYAIPIGNPDVLNTLAYSGIPITKNGYLYIWVSNETPGWDVFFDNLSIKQYTGPITEETHYYPFGLTMAGISSQAAGKLENKIKFQKQELQHKEFSDGSGLEMYQFKYRMDDPQIGRFWQIDPLADRYVYNSTYAFSENKVTNSVELEGLESVIVTNIYDKDHKQTGSSTTYYFNKEDYGPLGEGTYTADKQANGTFSENFDPAKGNSVNGFYADGLSQSRWTEDKGNFGGFETRLDARLIEKQAEDGLVSLGFDQKQVQKDVVVLETDNPSFKGKFAGFASDDVANKYTSAWSDRPFSDPHKSNKAVGSKPLGSSGLELKYYDGAQSKNDAVPGHLDLERAGLLSHVLDYIEGKYGSGNPGL